MADLKISQLTGATTPLAGTEVLPIVQSGVTKQVSVANLTAGRAVAMAGGAFSDNFTQGTAAKGINFTANTGASGMTSQLLNWYEEGAFTPTLTFGGNSTGMTGTFNGLYTRIGRQVSFSLVINLTNKGSSTGNATVAGLPFTSNGSLSQIFIMQGDNLTFSGGYVMAYLATSTTLLGVYTVASGSITQLTDTNFANNTLLRISGVYSV